MKLKRRLITNFIDESSEFHGYVHEISLNNGEFKDTYRSVFNTDFFPKLLDIAYGFSQRENPWDQKTIILEDDDMRLVFNFREFCGFNGDDEVIEEDKEKIERKGLSYVTMCNRIQIDVISDGVSDRDIFLYQIPRYCFCKNILDIIERDLDIYNKNIGMPDGYFRTKKEKIKTMSMDYFLKKKKEIMDNINKDLEEDIEDALNYHDKDDYGITEEEAEKLRKEYNID